MTGVGCVGGREIQKRIRSRGDSNVAEVSSRRYGVDLDRFAGPNENGTHKLKRCQGNHHWHESRESVNHKPRDERKAQPVKGLRVLQE
jgi:hypothetical protein